MCDNNEEKLIVEQGQNAEDAIMLQLVMRFKALLQLFRLFALLFLLVDRAVRFADVEEF